MFYITIRIIPTDPDGYRLVIDTDLPEEDLVKKVLNESLSMWDDRTSEGFDE